MIKVFDIEVENPAEYLDGEPQAKYLRINLKNIGKKAAKNCGIKILIYHDNCKLIREPSNLYPAGYHHFKKKKKRPPLIDIAAGDSQIFDICSIENRKIDQKLMFEDYVSHTQKTAELNTLHLRTYYIDLFVYSDNNPTIKKQYKIFIDNSKPGPDWSKFDIKEDKCEETKNQQEIKKKNQRIPPKSEINEKELKNIQYEGDHKANKKGGIIILGITDKIPRKIVGIFDLENKLQSISVIINKWIDYKEEFYEIREILLKDSNDNEKRCIAINIAQTKEIIAVKNLNGSYSYPIRLETGLYRESFSNLKKKKKVVPKTNFNFLNLLNNGL